MNYENNSDNATANTVFVELERSLRNREINSNICIGIIKGKYVADILSPYS